MPEPAILALTIMTYLLVKHTIADYFLQTTYMFKNKGRYAHPGGLLHAGLHVLLTAPVFLLFTPGTAYVAATILIGEFLIHYHVDWAKEQFNASRDLKPDCARFWNLHGLDQLLHGLTYIAIAAVLFAA